MSQTDEMWMVPHNLATGTIVPLSNYGVAIRIMPAMDVDDASSFVIPYTTELPPTQPIANDGIVVDPSLPCAPGTYGNNGTVCPLGMSAYFTIFVVFLSTPECIYTCVCVSSCFLSEGSFCPGDCYKHYCSNSPSDVPTRYHEEGMEG
jgi:hypothetical protein